MEFGIEKCAMIIRKSRKRQITEEIKLLDQERIRTFGEKENVQVLRNIGSEQHLTSGDERKN